MNFANAKRIEIEIVNAQYRFNTHASMTQPGREANGLVYYVKGGHGVDWDGGSVEARQDEVLFLPYASVYGSHLLETGTEYYQIDFLVYADGKCVPLNDEIFTLSKGEAAAFFSEIKAFYDVYVESFEGFLLPCLSYLYSLCGKLLRQRETESGRKNISGVNRALSHIRDHFDEDTPVSDLAEMANLSVSGLDKAFRHAFALSPVAYRTHLRIEHACKLLSGGFSIAETARRVGYENVYYFSKVFKKETGLTPGQFRKTDR